MTGKNPHTATGWKFTYMLSDSIDCDDSIRDRKDIEFITDVGKKQQKRITGFRITVGMPNEADAEIHASQTALGLVWLLVASSGTHSEHHKSGSEELVASGKRTVSIVLSLGYQIRGKAMVNVDDGTFDEILDNSSGLHAKVQFVAKAYQASRAHDYGSVVKYLVLAYNEDPPGQWAKFRYLRHALSHNRRKLNASTVDGLKNEFGPGYFAITGGKFDFASTQNLRRLETQAREFLKHAHDGLKSELAGNP